MAENVIVVRFEKEARHKIREQKRAELGERVQEKIESLKAKLTS